MWTAQAEPQAAVLELMALAAPAAPQRQLRNQFNFNERAAQAHPAQVLRVM
jgi:hypothetical protein